jgi:hypothetical protein
MKNYQLVLGSSSIKSYEFDTETTLLTVEFLTGAKYTYADVPPDIIQGLNEASSKGKYFSSNIKDKFITEKTGAPDVHTFPLGSKPL